MGGKLSTVLPSEFLACQALDPEEAVVINAMAAMAAMARLQEGTET